ncbi:Guanine nucleotide-binding protein subunit gamma [Pestalotiopsis sp. IQ-011]
MSGGHAATDIAAQESDVVQSVDASFGERHSQEEPDEKRWEYQCDEEEEDDDEFAPDAWTKMSAEFYYWRTVLVMVPSQETFKFLSSSSGFAFFGGRREFIEFQQWDPTRGLLR